MQEAAALATDALPAPPITPNLYQTELTPKQFHEMGVVVDGYVARMREVLGEKLGAVLEGEGR